MHLDTEIYLANVAIRISPKLHDQICRTSLTRPALPRWNCLEIIICPSPGGAFTWPCFWLMHVYLPLFMNSGEKEAKYWINANIFDVYNVSKRIALNDVGSSFSTRQPEVKVPCHLQKRHVYEALALMVQKIFGQSLFAPPRPTNVFNAFLWHSFVIVCFVDLRGILLSRSPIYNLWSFWKIFPLKKTLTDIFWTTSPWTTVPPLFLWKHTESLARDANIENFGWPSTGKRLEQPDEPDWGFKSLFFYKIFFYCYIFPHLRNLIIFLKK